jgi:HK97 gp10 family phage protein
MKITVSLEGVEKVLKGIQMAKRSVAKEVKEVVRITAFNIEKKAKKRVPVDTGHLRRSIRVWQWNNGYTFEVGTNVFYAPYVEFGTGQRGKQTGQGKKYGLHIEYNTDIRGQRAQPFLYPSFDEEKREYIKRIRNAIRKGLSA